LTLIASLGMTATATASPTYSVTQNQLFHATNLGPSHNTSCTILYDLYVPNAASATSQVPAILTTNGFGGSKNDQAPEAALWASHGYEVLSYSGLGFGGSSCQVYADDPDWDGRAASQLVSLLGNRPEVLKDGPGDPRVGTWGGSYGGGFQFALASVDPRIDAMVPFITWNDLTHSLAPNDNTGTFIYSNAPGVQKAEWSTLFYALGNAEPVLQAGHSGWTNTPASGKAFKGTPPNPACPGYEMVICTGYTESVAQGYAGSAIFNRLRHASAQYEFFQNPAVTHFPATMLIQGETDTLFDMADAVANYNGFKSKGATVKFVMESGGHSGPSAAGDYDNNNPANGYLTQLALNWFDRYLKGNTTINTGPEVEFFRDWVAYSGSSAPAYGSAPSWPVGTVQKWYLSGGSATAAGSLVSTQPAVQRGTTRFSSVPMSYSETSAVNGLVPLKPMDPPGQFAAYESAALTSDLVSVGIPQVDFNLQDLGHAADAANPGLAVTIFGKIYDVDGSGNQTLVHGITTSERVTSFAQPVHLNLPGLVHKYLAGHRIELVIATSDAAYSNSHGAHVLTITTSQGAPGVLSLPVGETNALFTLGSLPRSGGLPQATADVGSAATAPAGRGVPAVTAARASGSASLNASAARAVSRMPTIPLVFSLLSLLACAVVLRGRWLPRARR
jgi:predicted acyl esterase